MALPLVGGVLGGLFAGLSRLFSTRLGTWVAGAMLFLGIELVASNFVVGPLLDEVIGAFAGLPGDMAAWLAFLNVDRYITIVASAYATAASIGALKLRKVQA